MALLECECWAKRLGSVTLFRSFLDSLGGAEGGSYSGHRCHRASVHIFEFQRSQGKRLPECDLQTACLLPNLVCFPSPSMHLRTKPDGRLECSRRDPCSRRRHHPRREVWGLWLKGPWRQSAKELGQRNSMGIYGVGLTMMRIWWILEMASSMVNKSRPSRRVW